MKPMKSSLVAIMLCSFTVFGALQVQAQLPPDANQNTSESSATNRTMVADLLAEVGSLKSQIRRLNGQLEEYDYRLRQQQEDIDLLRKEITLQQQDLAAALKNGVSPVGTVPAPEEAQPVAPIAAPAVEPVEETVAVALPEASPAEQYKYAFAFIQKNDLASGRTALEQFMAANPDDSLAGNARYWLGRIHLQEGRNGQAAQQLLSLIENHPNHSKRADALVDLADALVKLGSSEDACNALAEFRRVNKDTNSRLQTRAGRVATDAKCG